MRTGLTVSVIGHAALLAWGVFALPVPTALDASQIEAVPVDFIELSDDTSIDKGAKTAALTEQPVPADPVRKIVDEPPPVPPPPEPEPKPPPPPPPEPAPPPEPPPPPAPAPEPPSPEAPAPPPPPPRPAPKAETPPPEASAIQPKPDTAPTPRPRPSHTEPAPQIAKKKDETSEIDQITAMLDKQPPESTESADQPATFGTPSGAVNSRMTASELDALRARLAQCWSPPVGWTDPSEVRVVLMLLLNADGSLSGAPQVLKAPAGRYAQTAAESAVRAVRRCAPYNLPAEKYDAWKEVRVTFDPIEMSGV